MAEALKELEEDPLVQVRLQASVAVARGAWLIEYAEEIVEAKNSNEPLEFDPEPILAFERNKYVVERVRVCVCVCVSNSWVSESCGNVLLLVDKMPHLIAAQSS